MGKQMTAQAPLASRLLAVALALTMAFAFGIAASAAAPEEAHAASTVSFKVKGTVDYGESYAFLAKLNKLRAKKGVGKLTMSKSLMKAAEQRAAEISVLFSHTRTDGTQCYTASSAINGENIAFASGFADAGLAYDIWRNSSGHYANMIRSSFKSAGVCCFECDGATYWVNVFGDGKGTTAKKKSSTPTKKYTVKLAKKYLKKSNLSFQPDSMNTEDTASVVVYLRTPDGVAILPNSLFKFKSSKPSVLSVNSKGKLTSKAEGKAKITLTVKKKTSCKVTQTVTVEDGAGDDWW